MGLSDIKELATATQFDFMHNVLLIHMDEFSKFMHNKDGSINYNKLEGGMLTRYGGEVAWSQAYPQPPGSFYYRTMPILAEAKNLDHPKGAKTIFLDKCLKYLNEMLAILDFGEHEQSGNVQVDDGQELMNWNDKRKEWRRYLDGIRYQVSCRQLGTLETREASRAAANLFWRKIELQNKKLAADDKKTYLINIRKIWLESCAESGETEDGEAAATKLSEKYKLLKEIGIDRWGSIVKQQKLEQKQTSD